MNTKGGLRPNSAKAVPMTTNPVRVSQLLHHYGWGPIPFVGDENAFYERHLVFDRVIDPEVSSAWERFKAFSRSVRDILAQRWVLTKKYLWTRECEAYLLENIYKVYAESFMSQTHLNAILNEAQEMVNNALGAGVR
jgi:hypothetical protein